MPAIPPHSLPVLDIQHATVYRRDACVFDDFSFSLQMGEHAAIVGPNGAGKSTLLKLLFGDVGPLPLDETRLSLFGLERWSVWDVRKHLGLVSHDLQRDYLICAEGLNVVLSRYLREEERALRYHAAGELPRALQALQASLATAELIDDRPAIVAQSLQIGFTALILGEGSLAERNFQRAWRTAVGLGDAPGVAQARLGMAQVGLMRGEFAAASEAFRRALVEARERSDRAAELVALNGLGLAEKELGRPEEGRELFREAEALARAHGDKRLLAATLAKRADMALRGGELGQAEPALAEAIEQWIARRRICPA